MSFAIDIRDGENRALAFPPHEKKLSGTVDIGGDRNDDFEVIGFDARIRDRWNEVKSARVIFSLHAATDLGQVVKLVGQLLIAGLAVAGLTFLAVNLVSGIPVPTFDIVPADDGIGFIIRVT